MTLGKPLWVLVALLGLSFQSTAFSDPSTDAGLDEIRTGLRGARPLWSVEAFLGLPKVWGIACDPASERFKSEVLKRYGLSYDAAFANDGLPVGLTQTSTLIYAGGGWKKGFTVSCQACHTARLLNRAFDGVGNVYFDYGRLYTDMQTAVGEPKQPFFEPNPNRNSIVSYSNYMGRLGIFARTPFPALNLPRFYAVFGDPDPRNALVQPLLAELPYRELVKTQPWIGYKYKIASSSGLYVDGGYHGSPSATHYALHFTLDPTGADFISSVQRFDQTGPAYLSSLKPPVYPWKTELNPSAVSRGQQLYDNRCASCHGTFSRDGTSLNFSLASYPGRLVDRATLKTDSLRIDYPYDYSSEIPDAIKALYTRTAKYIAPPLIGIWARAPYLHNGSVPTMMQLLNSKQRMSKFGIRPNPDVPEGYDKSNVGWTTVDLSNYSAAQLEALKKSDPYIRIFNPADHAGMTNGGHTFGDSMTDPERLDLMEFLKAI